MKSVIAIGVCSYDSRSGITVPEKWIFSENNPDFIHEMFRMNVINALRQDQSSPLDDFVSSTIEIPTYSCLAAFSRFGIKNKSIIQPFSVGIFVDTTQFRKTPQIMDMLMAYARNLASGAKSLVTKSKPLSKLGDVVRRFAEEINRILSAHIEKEYPAPDKWNDQFTRYVTSHLQTQMTTVIEAPSIEEANEIFALLLQFMLPYQRDLSSDQIFQTAVPHLFLQIVSPQSSIDEQILGMQRPCTWIRVAEKQVCQLPQSEKQSQEYGDLFMAMLLDEDTEWKKKLSKLKGQIKTNFTGACTILASQGDVIRHARTPQLVYGQLLSSIVRQALTFIALIDDFLRLNEKPEVQREMVSEVKKYLKLSKKDDELVVLAIAQLFDPRILAKWYSPPWQK